MEVGTSGINKGLGNAGALQIPPGLKENFGRRIKDKIFPERNKMGWKRQNPFAKLPKLRLKLKT